jgi:hypothetical protein
MSNVKTIIPDKFTMDDIGATLLNELSGSIYEPGDVIREYVQNAVDAHKLNRVDGEELPEEPIAIYIRPDSVSIVDYGIGMDIKEVSKVKGISISEKIKKGVDLTGQKGVGIWSGLSYFQKIVIETTKAGVDKKYFLTISFGDILEKLHSKDADALSVAQVLDGNHLLEEMDADLDEHGTTVTLHSPRADQAPEFLDAERIKESIRRYAPCVIDPDFKFVEEVRKWYDENNLTFIPIVVGNHDVYKSYHNGLSKFSTGTISVGDKTVVKYWLAIADRNDKIKDEPNKIPSGFALIQNGFALDRNYGAASIGNYPELETPYIPWYVGEMHITNEYVLPNLDRKGLQLTGNTLKLIDNLREWYGVLDSGSRQISYIRLQIEAYNALSKRIDEIIKLIDDDAKDEISEKIVDKFMMEYEREMKRMVRIADSSKYSEFILHSYKVALHREMSADHKKLNIKWNEVREQKPGLRTLAQISKGEKKVKDKPEKTSEAAPPNLPVTPTIPVELQESSTVPEATHDLPQAKINLTRDIAVNLLRGSLDEMDPPLLSKPVIDRIVKNFSKILDQLVGNV